MEIGVLPPVVDHLRFPVLPRLRHNYEAELLRLCAVVHHRREVRGEGAGVVTAKSSLAWACHPRRWRRRLEDSRKRVVGEG